MTRHKVVLIHPLGYEWPAPGVDMARLSSVMPPIGLLSIAAWLERHGVDATVIDAYAHPASHADIVRAALAEKPDLVGLTVTTPLYHDAARLATELKRAAPGVPVVFGGVHASSLRERMMEDCPAIDFAIVGEGEETTLDLVRRGREEPAAIAGLLWRDGEAIVANPPRPRLPDLDALPLPAYDKLRDFPGAYPLPIFNYPRAPGTACVASRGCPYSCSYCDRSVFGRSHRANSADYLYDHLAHLRRVYGIRHVNLYDDQFTLRRDRVIAFCERMAREPLGLTFNCALRADHTDPEMLRLMKRAGAWMVSIGVETADPGMIATHRQGVNLDQTTQAIRWIKQAGLRVKGLLIMGLPGETEETIRRTRDYVLGLPFDDINLTKFAPFPGAPVHADIAAHGEFDEDWDRLDCLHFLFIPRGFTRARLEALYNEFLIDFYRRWRRLPRYLAMPLVSPHSLWRFLRDFPSFWRYRNQMLEALAANAANAAEVTPIQREGKS